MSSLRDELKEGFARTHERLDEMNARIASLEATRAHATGWVSGAKWLGGALLAGALWVLGRVWPVVLVALLTSCYETQPIAALDRPEGAQGRWYEQDRPVTVVLEPTMPEPCKQAVRDAVDYARLWTPTTFGEVVEGRDPVVAYLGEIAFVVRPRLSPDSTLAGLAQPYGMGDRLTRAYVILYEPWCGDWLIALHELGHALGLADVNAPGRAMHGGAPNGVELTVEEREWVR